MGLIEFLFGWEELTETPKWISKSSKMGRAHYFATHSQIPGTTKVYYFKGKHNLYKVKVKSTGQYSFETVFRKKLK